MLERGQLGQKVAELLERRIIAGEWAAGSTLPSEGDICALYEVSKPIVREAIRILASRGLVQTHQGRGTAVLEVNSNSYSHAIRLLLMRSDVTFGDTLQARAILESAVAAEAANSRTDDDLLIIRGHLSDFGTFIKRQSFAAAVKSHQEFHAALLRATHKPALEVLLVPMTTIVFQSSVPIEPTDSEQWIFELHERIFAAVEAADPDAAAQAMRRHFTEVLESDRFVARATDLLLRDIPSLEERMRNQTDSQQRLTQSTFHL